MEKLERLLHSLTQIIKAEEDDVTAKVPEFPGLEKVPDLIEKFEKATAKLLRKQRKYYIDGVNGFVSKGIMDTTLAALLAYVTGDLFAADEFAEDMSAEAAAFLTMTVAEITPLIMEAIDKDIAFNTFSQRTIDWIDSWSKDLGELMKLTSHHALEKELKEALEKGEGIDEVVGRIKDLPEFDRKRARRTAITEILTACSASQQEAYLQSPAVTGKTWLHSGEKNITPRPAHVELHDTTIPVDEKFDVNGHEADFPRDPSLPASERVECHCALAPAVDENILALSKEEKEKIRQQVLDDLAK
jgi:hypothetical protein